MENISKSDFVYLTAFASAAQYHVMVQGMTIEDAGAAAKVSALQVVEAYDYAHNNKDFVHNEHELLTPREIIT